MAHGVPDKYRKERSGGAELAAVAIIELTPWEEGEDELTHLLPQTIFSFTSSRRLNSPSKFPVSSLIILMI